MTPTEQLRRFVVRTVVLAIAGLCFLLYAGVGVLLALDRTVPGELWLAAGNASGALFALLANSKGDRDTVTVDQPADQPVPVVPG